MKEINTKRLESDHVLLTMYRDLFDARTPDANIIYGTATLRSKMQPILFEVDGENWQTE